jgi:hypothetical protein
LQVEKQKNMDEKLDIFQKIVEDFTSIPKIVYQTTYLDICKYSGRRFEEICSRILEFYFNPNNEHGFNDLFLSTFLEVIPPEINEHGFNDSEVIPPKPKVLQYRNDLVKTKTEIVCEEDKRLDIMIYSPCFVIGIENKIRAPLYNRIDIYGKKIDEYGTKMKTENIFKVVFSVRKITDQTEIKKINDNGFVKIYYSTFFEKLKVNVGKYISHANQKYLIFMYDFIQTIENMEGQFDSKLYRFFAENKENLDELFELYGNYKGKIWDTQKLRISEILERIKSETNDEWSVWQGWLLGINNFNKNTKLPQIGIVANYDFADSNPLGNFKISIQTWQKEHFQPYEDILKKKYPDREKSEHGTQVSLRLDVIKNDSEDEIIEQLKRHYDELKEIVAELSKVN